MTKRSKSGTVAPKLTPKSKNEILGNEFKVTEMNAANAPVQDVNWIGQEIEARSDIGFENDQGDGKPIILRQFEFALPMGVPMNQLPSKAKLLEFHKSKIVAFLWKDELELIAEPKIVMEGRKFKIFATCQGKKGSLIFHKPQTLSDVAQGRTG